MIQQDKFVRINRRFARNWPLGVGMLILGMFVFFIPLENMFLTILFVMLLVCEIIGGLWFVSFVINPFLALHDKRRMSTMREETNPPVIRHKVSSKMYSVIEKFRLEKNFTQLHLECTPVFFFSDETYVRLQILPTFSDDFSSGKKSYLCVNRDIMTSYENIRPITLENIFLPDGTQLPTVQLQFATKTSKNMQKHLLFSTCIDGVLSEPHELKLNEPIDLCINMDEIYEDETTKTKTIVVCTVTWIGGIKK